MIATFILQIFYSFLGFLINLLPTGSLNASVASSITSIWGMMNAFSYVIALDTFIQVLLLAVAFDLVVLLWHFINWIIKKVPGMH